MAIPSVSVPVTLGLACEDVFSGGIGQLEVVFVPADPPRTGSFYCYESDDGHVAPATIDLETSIEVVWPTASSVRRRSVRATCLSVTDAIAVLREAENYGGSVSAVAWSRAISAGLVLIGRGRLYPSVSPGGFDAWVAGPLTASDRTTLDEFAAALPATGHATVLPGVTPLTVSSPRFLIRALWDALADSLVRSPAATVVTGHDLFAATRVQSAEDARAWLDDASELEGGADVALRIEMGGEHVARAVVQLSSRADPSLIVDLDAVFGAPLALRTRFGDDVQTDVLRTLRRGARLWSPLEGLLRQRVPGALDLGEDEVADLLGPACSTLADVGIAVLWPAALVRDGVRLDASISADVGRVDGSGLDLATLVAFRWRLTLDGETLSEQEVNLLAEAKRGLVRIRGKFVVADPELMARARSRREHRLSAIEALAAALSGSVVVDGERVAVSVSGTLNELASRLSRRDAVEDEFAIPDGLLAELRPYQRRGVAWLESMVGIGLGGCLADDMGLGKTLQVIALHLASVASVGASTLVICPTSLLGNWEREIRRFAPGVPVRRFHGGERTLEDLAAGEIVITSYGVARREAAALDAAAFSLVVADEAQYVKNPASATARSLRRISSSARLALTGTPVENRLSDLWAILDWTTPGLLGSLEHFVRHVATPIERYHDPVVTERLARTVRPFLLRRRKTDPEIAPDLPARTVSDVPVALSAEQVQLYEAEVREAMDAIGRTDGIQRQALVLRLLTVLKQICNHPAHYLHQAGPLAGRSGKFAVLEELLPVIISEGDSVLVFSQFVECLTLIEARLSDIGIATLFLHGKVSPTRRSAMVEAFQAGHVPVFLLSLKAGGVGLNLTRATHVIHVDRWWNPATEDQATDRAHRIGQDRPVQVHRLVTEGTLEDRISELIEKKRGLAEAVVGGGEAWIGRMSDAELADLVALGRAP